MEQFPAYRTTSVFNMKRAIITYVLLIVLGCAPEDLIIEVTPQQSGIVLSSRFVPDNLLIVTASRSFSALAPSDFEALENDFVERLLVDSALITVTSGSTTDTLLEVVPGFFIGELSEPGIESSFVLTVFDSTTSTYVTAETVLNSSVSLNDAELLRTVQDDDTTFTIKYEFTDPEVPNWYLVQATSLDGLFSNQLQDLDFDSLDSGESNFSSLFNPNFESEVLFTKLLSDITFENNEVTREVQLFENPGDTLAMILINISEEYYRFLDAGQRSGGIIASAANEPVNFPSNVENGFGFFSMNTPDIRIVVKED